MNYFFISTTFTFLLLFLISLLGMFINKKNILIMLMSLEMLFLASSFFFIFSAVYLDDISGQIFAILILTVAASESAIGLAILVIYYRIRNTISVELMDLMKG
uniref:NADH dehydrogenase subunit 4L n=1 Tax=Centroceras gasparrinii TaxID=371099 RepID=UPI002E7A4B1F|nr:NADH dehydrogenase subunit 4L [Centroceras gasparrinii]WQF69481.1 NADH dehydrogenase subunit 4L [Centroceras gasparrinii]